MHAVARLILRDADLAQDATQEALVRAWRDLPSLREVERFDAWIYRVTVRACSDIRKSRRRWQAELTVVRSEPSERDRSSELADRDELEHAFLELSVEHRAVLVLTHYVGLPATEVGAILGIPPGTVSSRLHYGVRAMRAVLSRSPSASAPPPFPEHVR
jgi:RNA polymerase sigma-70 factor (ECF subfamily)